MLTTLDEFLVSLMNSGVMDRTDLSRFLENLPQGAAISDAESLARELHRQSLLTVFQAREILKGKARGLVLGPYVVLDFAGGGGMGCVYKARHRDTGKVVALKTLSPALADTTEAVERFQREVETWKRLEHPHIVAVLDSGQASSGPFLVMEYVEGRDLYTFVKLSGPLPIPQSVSCVLQAASGLQYAHEQGVVHRDVKPSNLLLDERGIVRLVDLGLVRLMRLDLSEPTAPGRLTRQKQMLGTPDYMSPEQARDPRTADARSDIYSLGCTWHFLLTGRSPYGGDTDIMRLLAHREQPVPSLRVMRPHVPEEADAIFQKMLAKRPEDRFQTMAEVITALQTSVTVEAGPAVSSCSSEPWILGRDFVSERSIATAKMDAETVDYAEQDKATGVPTETPAPADVKRSRRAMQVLLPLVLFVVITVLLALAVILRL
jgi:serine/threonine protein kinase